jgi:hypothetical protein
MPKFDIRVSVEMTLDFEVVAEDEFVARDKIDEYLKHVQGGKIDEQRLSIKTDDGDKLTNCFIMEAQIEDVNEIE